MELSYRLDGKYHSILELYGADFGSALVEAGLPGDHLLTDEPAMTVTQYYRFMDALGKQEHSPRLALDVARSEQALRFSPEIYAASLSKNARIAFRRISMYKQVQGLVRYLLDETSDTVRIEFSLADGSPMPPFLIGFEICFIIRLIREATGKRVVPSEVVLRNPPEGHDPEIDSYIGIELKKGDRDYVSFSRADMDLPFREHDDMKWAEFAPDIFRAVYKLEDKGGCSRAVQSALIKLLPSGSAELDDVSRELGISRRTLQRRLLEEGTSFREETQRVREKIALYYLEYTEYTVENIAYLLGYTEYNSFVRSFKLWTGCTACRYRKEIRKQQ